MRNIFNKGEFKLHKEKKEKKNHKKLKFVIIAVALFIALFLALIGFITDFLWFKDLGYVAVFFTKLLTQLKLALPAFIIVTIVTFIYLKILKKNYFEDIASNDLDNKKSMNSVSLLISGLFGFMVALYVSGDLWFKYLQFKNSTNFKYDDPLFGFDISFYIFKLDFLHSINQLIIFIAVMLIVVTIAYYLILMAVRPPRVFKTEEPTGFEEYDRFDNQENSNIYEADFKKKSIFSNLGNIFKIFSFANFKNTKSKIDNQNVKHLFKIASVQMIVAGVLLFIMIAIHFFLKQFDLLHSHTGAVYGAGYTDVKVTLVMYRILIGLSILGAISIIVGVKKHKIKYIVVIPILMVVVGVGGQIAKPVVQSLIVSSNEIAKESKYLRYNIEFTQKAYGLENVTTKAFEANNNLTAQDIRNNDAAISNIRINDYLPTKTFYNQTQSIRQYYDFVDVDVDRYMINGEYAQTFLSAREIDEKKISQTWLNKHIKYTHGYGITLSKVDEVTASGQPKMLLKNIPSESSAKEIKITRPEIYFGENTNNYVVVGAKESEFNYPNGDNNEYSRYEGAAGIKLNFINKLMFAIKEKNIKLLVSSTINSDSKILIDRNIMTRVNKIMPHISYDKDPYMVTVNGKLYWIIDGYTTSNRFPYSEPYDTDSVRHNYVRNSVKVVIDAYNGYTDFYIVDNKDPIAATYKKIYPTLFKDISKMPEAIKEHLRYPNELLETQAEVYTRYHMNDEKVFYQNEDLWDIAKEIYGSKEKTMSPSYYIMKLPGEKGAEFVNSIPFTTRNKRNLTGLMIARNDGKNYGELVVYKMPKNKVVYGPRQIEAQIDQDTEISKEFSLWSSAGSQYSRGNMFVIPIEQSLLYVEPVYLESSEASIPEVKRVIVAYGDKIAYKPTLAEALVELFGDNASKTDVPKSSENNHKTADNNDSNVSSLAKKAQEEYNKAQEALKNGDWAAYGEHMNELESILNKLK
ncbi:MAG: UPF0182 family protein [Eubacteriales bacterium]|nr:UPF0182 family protein [Eubacteriales bacterium]MDY3333260.1 UPF0182 family protein [Gallibacter sp.]